MRFVAGVRVCECGRARAVAPESAAGLMAPAWSLMVTFNLLTRAGEFQRAGQFSLE